MGSAPEDGARQGFHGVRKRMAKSQSWGYLGSPLLLALVLAMPWGVGPIQAFLIVAGSLPAGIVFGFLLARRIASKADALGVYRRKAMSVAKILVLCTVLQVSFTLLANYLLPRSITAAIFCWIGGLALGAPVGTILFERRARSRLWVYWIPSPWWPERIEYHLEYRARGMNMRHPVP